MFATFAPTILWFAHTIAAFAPMIAAFALGIFSKTHQSSLSINGGIFSKITPSLFTMKEGSTPPPDPPPLRGQGMCQPPYSVLKPLRYKVGGPSEVFASSRAAFCGMRPHGHESLTGCYGLHGLLGVLLIWAARVAFPFGQRTSFLD